MSPFFQPSSNNAPTNVSAHLVITETADGFVAKLPWSDLTVTGRTAGEAKRNFATRYIAQLMARGSRRLRGALRGRHNGAPLSGTPSCVAIDRGFCPQS